MSTSQQGEAIFPRGGMITTVLYHCARCPKMKTEALNGHWSLDQLKRDDLRADTISEAATTTEES